MLHKETIDHNTWELLISLQRLSHLKGFWLAGGSSLALQIGHRKSDDIDLFSMEPFDNQEMLEFLEEEFQFHLDFSATNTLRGSINNIKVDILAHKYPLVSKVVEEDGILLYSKEDIAAMKLNAIAGNGTRSKDFIDIYFLLKYFSLSQIIGFYSSKYKLRNEMHVLKSLVYFNDVDLNDWPILVLEQDLTFGKVKKRITAHVKNYSNSELF